MRFSSNVHLHFSLCATSHQGYEFDTDSDLRYLIPTGGDVPLIGANEAKIS